MGSVVSSPEIVVGAKRVTVLRRLGEGGFAFVDAVTDGQHHYALKRMAANEEEQAQVAEREVELTKSLPPHKNIVKYVAAGKARTNNHTEILLLTELATGGQLPDIIARRHQTGHPFTAGEVIAIFEDICRAVDHLHQQHPPIAHRDIKPENILLGADGLFKLCDFGSCTTRAQVYESRIEIIEEEDRIQKYTSPQYRAPEMCDLYQRRLINEKVDVWALGGVLYMICFNKLAFDGASPLAILNGNYEIPQTPEYPPGIVFMIQSCLQLDPAHRPTTSALLDSIASLRTDSEFLPPTHGFGHHAEPTTLAEVATTDFLDAGGAEAKSRASPPGPHMPGAMESGASVPAPVPTAMDLWKGQK